MSVLSEQVVSVLFTTANPGTGEAQNADTLPSATLYINGVASSVPVTVTNLATGIYRATLTLPELEPGDVLSLCATATVDSTTATGIIWQDTCETAALPGDAMTLTSEYDAAKTAAQPGDEMDLVDEPNPTALTAAARAVWNLLTSAIETAGGIGKYLLTKLGLLGSGQVVVSSPVTASGDVETIEGDDYKADDGRALEWRISTAADFTGGTAVIIIHGMAAFEGSIEMVEEDVALVRLELTHEETSAIGSRPATYPYSIVATQSPAQGGDVITLLRGRWRHFARHVAPVEQGKDRK